jgi:hypothetical protein
MKEFQDMGAKEGMEGRKEGGKECEGEGEKGNLESMYSSSSLRQVKWTLTTDPLWG